MKWRLVIFGALLTQISFAQEMIYPATIGTNIDHKLVKRGITEQQQKDDVMLELPFIDDFSVDRFPGNEGGYQVLWEGRQATRNNGWPLNAPTVGAVSFDGADEFGYPYDWEIGTGSADTLTSCPINLEGNIQDNYGISFYYQPKGNAHPQTAPSANDTLVLEFYAPEMDEWFWVWSTNDLSVTDEFTFVYLPINQTRYLKEGFQFRFRNYARLQGALDTWNVDYVWVDLNNNNSSEVIDDVAFAKQEFSILNNYTAIPRDHFAEDPASQMIDAIRILYRNLNDVPRTLQGNKVRVIDALTGTVMEDHPNPSNPAVPAGSTLEYAHTINSSPNNIVYDPSTSDTELDYEVQFIHDVADFNLTASNDTMRFHQKFFTHYAYDDGSAEASYAVPSAGADVALRYDVLKTDSIWALEIYTMPFGYDYEGTPITVTIWEDENGQPGDVISQKLRNIEFGVQTYQEAIIYQFDSAIYVPSGSIFVGYQQSNQEDGIRVGIDFNTEGNEGNLFYNEGLWQASSMPGSVMIRPMFTSNGYEDLVTKADFIDFSDQVKVYPNPARNVLNINTDQEGMLIGRVYDISGRMLDSFQFRGRAQRSVSSFENGVYLLIIDDELGNRGVKKWIVNH